MYCGTKGAGSVSIVPEEEVITGDVGFGVGVACDEDGELAVAAGGSAVGWFGFAGAVLGRMVSMIEAVVVGRNMISSRPVGW